MLIKAGIHYQSVKKVHIEVTYGWLLFWHHLAITPTYLFFSVTKERKPIQTRQHKVKFEDQSDPMSGQTLTYLFWAMANMFFPILTEETRDFSVLAVNILYLTDVSICPGRPPIAHTQIPSQYTHIDLAIDLRCQDDVHYLQVAVLFLCYFSPHLSSGGKLEASKKSTSSPIAI